MNNRKIIQIALNHTSKPPVTYRITDFGCGEKGEDYSSKYIDVADFNSFMKRFKRNLMAQLKRNKSI